MFHRYAKYYDLLNRNKQYELEADFAAARLREVSPNMLTILELGSGTGGHARLLAAKGFSVLGISAAQRWWRLLRGFSRPRSEFSLARWVISETFAWHGSSMPSSPYFM